MHLEVLFALGYRKDFHKSLFDAVGVEIEKHSKPGLLRNFAKVTLTAKNIKSISEDLAAALEDFKVSLSIS